MQGVLSYIQELKGKIEKLKIKNLEKAEKITKILDLIIESPYFKMMSVANPTEIIELLRDEIDFPYFLDEKNIADINEKKIIKQIDQVKAPMTITNSVEQKEPIDEETYKAFIEYANELKNKIEQSPLLDNYEELKKYKDEFIKIIDQLNVSQRQEVQALIFEIQYLLVKQDIISNGELTICVKDWNFVEKEVWYLLFKEIREILDTVDKNISKKQKELSFQVRVFGGNDTLKLIKLVIDIEAITKVPSIKEIQVEESPNEKPKCTLEYLDAIEKRIGEYNHRGLYFEFEELSKLFSSQINAFSFIKRRELKKRIEDIKFTFFWKGICQGITYEELKSYMDIKEAPLKERLLIEIEEKMKKIMFKNFNQYSRINWFLENSKKRDVKYLSNLIGTIDDVFNMSVEEFQKREDKLFQELESIKQDISNIKNYDTCYNRLKRIRNMIFSFANVYPHLNKLADTYYDVLYEHSFVAFSKGEPSSNYGDDFQIIKEMYDKEIKLIMENDNTKLNEVKEKLFNLLNSKQAKEGGNVSYRNLAINILEARRILVEDTEIKEEKVSNL